MSFVGISEAVILVKDMKLLYGKQFVDQWGFASDVELAERVARLLSDVHIVQFEYGMKRMESHAYIPTLPKFKELCLELKPQGQNWLSVNEAWALCLNFQNDRKTRVTTQAMAAFEKIENIFHVEGQKAAFHAFKGFYSRIIESDQAKGRYQEAYKPPKLICAPRDTRVSDTLTDSDIKIREVCLDEIYQKLDFKPRTSRSCV